MRGLQTRDTFFHLFCFKLCVCACVSMNLVSIKSIMSSDCKYFGLFGESPSLSTNLNFDEEELEEGEIKNDESNVDLINTKECIICNSVDIKYKCPSCEMRTCSLACVNKHKDKYDCSGRKVRTRFKKLSEIDDDSFLKGKVAVPCSCLLTVSFFVVVSDYLFLEDCDRVLDNFKRDIKSRVKSQEQLPSWLKKLVYEARIRGTRLKILPAGFKKRCDNTTAFMYSLKQIHWDIELKFSHLRGKSIEVNQFFPMICNRVSETSSLESVLKSIFNSDPILESKIFHIFSLYREANSDHIVAKLEQGKDLIKVNIKDSIKDILSGKVIIEYPTFYISLIKSNDDTNFLINHNFEIDSDEFDLNL